MRHANGTYVHPAAWIAWEFYGITEFLQTTITERDARELELGNASRAQMARRASR